MARDRVDVLLGVGRLPEHSSMSLEQSTPVHPGGHVHMNSPVMGDVLQVDPSARHGLDAQASSR